MGSAYSYVSYSPENSTSGTSAFEPGSIYDLDPIAQNVEEYEADFKNVCRRVATALEPFKGIPCQQSSKEIVTCLRKNPGQMGNCLPYMNYYRLCVAEATRNNLDKFIYEIKT